MPVGKLKGSDTVKYLDKRTKQGANDNTIDYELAVLEMRQAASTLGRALVSIKGETSEDVAFIPNLRRSDNEFFNLILVEHGAYDIQPAEIKRIISEARFLAHRI